MRVFFLDVHIQRYIDVCIRTRIQIHILRVVWHIFSILFGRYTLFTLPLTPSRLLFRSLSLFFSHSQSLLIFIFLFILFIYQKSYRFFSVLLSLVLHSLTQSKIWNTNEIEFESETWLQMCFHTVHVHRELACKQNDCQTYPSQFGDVAGDNVCFIIILKWAGLQSQLVIFFFDNWHNIEWCRHIEFNHGWARLFMLIWYGMSYQNHHWNMRISSGSSNTPYRMLMIDYKHVWRWTFNSISKRNKTEMNWPHNNLMSIFFFLRTMNVS